MSSTFNVLLNVLLIVYLIIFTLVVSYSGINAGKVTQLESGGECDGLGFPLLSHPVARRWLSSCTGLGYRHHASTYLLKRIANGGPQGSHLNPPSNGASVPVQVPCMCTPPNFSIKAVHATPQGSLLVSCWLSHI